MATLKKMTRVGADVRQIARLLQAKAPEGHMLAYITPEEAELLKAQGGSGKPHADTGVPSFEVGETGMGSDYSYGDTGTKDIMMPPVDTPVPFNKGGYGIDPGKVGVENQQKYYLRPIGEAPLLTSLVDSQRQQEAQNAFVGPTAPEFLPSSDRAAVFGPTGYGEPATLPELAKFDTSRPAPTVGDRFKDLAKTLGVEESTLGRLGLGGIQAVLGARTARKAAEQGRVGKAEQQALAQPYQAKGAELQRAAQAGELTPQSQQALQAVQAQTAQQAAARGGVGAMQSQAQVEAFRQQLLQQQYDYGLKLSGIGDQIALGAIKTGLQADQYVNELTSNYYNNIARSLLPAPAQQVVTRG